MKSPRHQFPLSVVALGAWYQFGKAQKVVMPEVESRALIWCKAGSGTVHFKGENLRLETDHYLLVPWRCKLHYHADTVSPFLIAGIYFVPWHHPGRPVKFGIPHCLPPTPGGHTRRDLPWPEFTKPSIGSFEQHPALRLLAEYALLRYIRENPREEPMRELARLLTDEIQVAFVRAEPRSASIDLERMDLFIENHLHRPIGIKDLIEFSKLSGSTIHRLFIRHHGVAPKHWILRKRIAAAQNLLKSTRLGLREIGPRVGIEDPFYFSRFFRKQTGETPTHYRKRSTLF